MLHFSSILQWFGRLILLAAFLLAVILLLFLYNPSWFINDIENYIANKISHYSANSYNVNIKELRGDFIDGFNLKEISINSQNGNNFSIDSLILDPDISDLLSLNIALNKLSLHSSMTYFSENSEDSIDFNKKLSFSSNLIETISQSFSPFTLRIDTLLIKNFSVLLDQNQYTINSNLSLLGKDGITAIIDSFVVTKNNIDLFKINNREPIVFRDGIYINNLNYTLYGKSGVISLNIPINDENNISSEITLSAFQMPIGRIGKEEIEDIKLILERNLKTKDTYNTNISFYIFNQLITTHIDFIFNNNKIKFTSTPILTNEGIFILDGFYDLTNSISNIKFNISNVVTSYAELDDISIDCNSYGITSINCKMMAEKIKYNNFNLDSLFTKFSLKENGWSSDKILIYSNAIDVNISNVLYSNMINRFDAEVKINDLSKLVDIAPILPEDISGQGIVEINYSNIDSNINSNSVIKVFNYSWDNLHFSKGKFSFNKNNSQLRGTGKINDLSFHNIYFDDIDLSILPNDKNQLIMDFIANNKSTGERLILHSFFNNDSQLVVNKFYGVINNVQFESKGININKIENYYSVAPSSIKIGNGELFFNFKYENMAKYSLKIRTSNLDLDELNKLFTIQRRLDGIANGELFITQAKNYPILLANISIRDGYFDDIIFRDLDLQASIRDRRLVLSTLDVSTDLGNLNASGWFTTSLSLKGNPLFHKDDSLNLTGTFDKFDITYFNRYFPWEQSTSGLLSGNFKINGNAKSPRIELNSKIENPKFDLINGKSLTGIMIYNNERIFLKRLNFITEFGRYTGSGSIPSNLNFITIPQLDIDDMPMDFIFTGNATAFEFLPPYFEILDSLNGEFNMQLNLSGSLKKPIREGQISIQNGKINILQLDNPITNINGYARIANNRLVLNKLTANLNDKTMTNSFFSDPIDYTKKIFYSDEIEEKNNNVDISGSMDLNNFFEPNFSINLHGQNIFMTSTYGQFEGVGNANIFITGQDTILISGDFTPNANQFTLFSLGDDYDLKMEDINNQTILAYDIHVPLDNGIKVKTDLIDLFVEGDININSFGNDDFTFSGKVQIADGNFNYNGNEFVNTEGLIILDPSDEIPYAEVHAETILGDEVINVTFIGFLDNPSLILESSSAIYSQSDILQLLTFRNSDFSVTDTPTEQVGDFLSNYLENEFEKNVTLYTDLDEFKLQRKGSLVTGFQDAEVNVYLGKRLSSNLYVNTKINLNELQTNEYEVSYRLNPNMSIVAKIDENQHWHFNYRFKYRY